MPKKRLTVFYTIVKSPIFASNQLSLKDNSQKLGKTMNMFVNKNREESSIDRKIKNYIEDKFLGWVGSLD